MATVDLSNIVALTTQINALNQAMNSTSDPSVKALLKAQLDVATAQLTSTAQHQQAQVDASNNLLDSLGLFSTLTSLVGGTAPSIIALFHK